MSSSISGKVVKGRGLGKTLGFPTINLECECKGNGVFVAEVLLDGKIFISAVHIGPKPTLSDFSKGVEAYLLNFSKIVKPNSLVTVNLKQKIREVKKFKHLDDLKFAINKDVDFVRSWYNSHTKK